MSSKLDMSVRIPSGPSSCDEEWTDEDLEDLDPDRSGGELGAVEVVVMSSLLLGANVAGQVKER